MTTATGRVKSELQSVDHLVAVLETLASARSPLALKYVTESVGLARTTAFRLLTALEQHGFARRDPASGGYTLGPSVFVLAERYLHQLDHRAAAKPALEWLWGETHFTVHFSILDRAEVVYIDKIDGLHPLQAHTNVGGRAPAYAVSAGLAQLAFLEETSLPRHLPTSLIRFTPSTPVDPDEFAERLRVVREQGCAVNAGGWRSQIGGISAPVFRYDGTVVASLGVVLPSSELDEEVIGKTVPIVKEAAAMATRLLRAGGETDEP